MSVIRRLREWLRERSLTERLGVCVGGQFFSFSFIIAALAASGVLRTALLGAAIIWVLAWGIITIPTILAPEQ